VNRGGLTDQQWEGLQLHLPPQKPQTGSRTSFIGGGKQDLVDCAHDSTVFTHLME
jgi:hypothetical protein